MSVFIGKTLTIFFLLSAFLPIVARVTSANILSLLTAFKLIGLASIFGLWFLSFSKKTILLKKNILIFLCIFFSVLIIFTMHFLRGMDPVAFQVFRLVGLPYIPLAVIVFCELKGIKGIIKIFDIIGKTAVICSLVAFAQWIVGPYFLKYTLGLDFEIGRSEFHYGSAATVDGRVFFRAFSTAMSHYEFSIIVVMGMIIYASFFWMGKINLKKFIVNMLILFIGMMTTYNMTSWAIVVMVACFMLFIKGRHYKEKLSYNKFIFIGTLITMLVVLSTFLFFKMNMDERLLSNIGAGGNIGSLGWRAIFFIRSLTLIRMQPLGWGWGHADGKEGLPLFITSDNYFLYYAVLGGIHFFIFHTMLFIVPFFYAIKRFKIMVRAKNPEYFYVYLAAWAFLAASFLSGFSNGNFITSGVSNYLVWPVVGIIYKLPKIVLNSNVEKHNIVNA